MFSRSRWVKILPLSLVLFLPCIVSEWNTNDFLKREHTLLRPYQGTGMTIPNWDFIGSTIVTKDYVRLTADDQSRQGGLWNSVPCRLRNWELQVQFKVHGRGKDLFGDGFAIWYTKDRMKLGPVFGAPDFFLGLGVIVDTYSNHNGEHNHQHPYISAMVNNGTLHYDHDRDGTHTQLAGCEAKFRNVKHDTYIAVRYVSDTLQVFTDLNNKRAWKECFTVRGVKLPTGYYFGFSATTGDLSDNHDIISVRLYELQSDDTKGEMEDRGNILPQAVSFEPPRERIEDSKPTSSLKMLFYILFFSLLLVAVVIGGVYLYNVFNEDRRKRFY